MHGGSPSGADCPVGSHFEDFASISDVYQVENEREREDADDLSALLAKISRGEEEGVGSLKGLVDEDDAINVDEISDAFTELDANQSTELLDELDLSLATDQELQDADNVDEMAGWFSFLDQPTNEEKILEEDYDDAENVDDMSMLFSSLVENCADQAESLTQEPLVSDLDSLDAENVDYVSSLFSALEDEEAEKLKTPVQQPARVFDLHSALPRVAANEPSVHEPRIDSRIFVPKFSVRIDQASSPAAAAAAPFRPCGPPSLLLGSSFLVGPPPPVTAARDFRVERWKEKRKQRPVTKVMDPSVSDMRRACAAKRQRVKGRFTSENNGFVSITALQN